VSDHTFHKLWGGRFAVPTAAALDALNRSIGTDYRLWPFDINLSRAWAVALWGAEVISLEESKTIEKGLAAVAEKLTAGTAPISSDEDVHTMIDRMLHDEVGDVASKLHTGRSRNDQVATATRLWSMDACAKLDSAARTLQQVMLDHAETLQDTLMPAYTHLQRAQPVAAAHWMLSHLWDPALLPGAHFQFRACFFRVAWGSAASRKTVLMRLATGISSLSCYSPSR